MNKYPEGAISSYEELCKVEMENGNGLIYIASREFKTIETHKPLSLKLCQMRDANIPANSYNDWFIFADEAKAKEWAA